MSWVGAVMPGTVGGRRAHPPKADKIWSQKINTTERRKAIRSAIAGTINMDFVKDRGHKAPENYPFIIANSSKELPAFAGEASGRAKWNGYLYCSVCLELQIPIQLNYKIIIFR